MLRMSLGVILAGGLSLLGATSADATTDGAARLLVPHRAIYDLEAQESLGTLRHRRHVRPHGL